MRLHVKYQWYEGMPTRTLHAFYAYVKCYDTISELKRVCSSPVRMLCHLEYVKKQVFLGFLRITLYTTYVQIKTNIGYCVYYPSF